MSAVPRTRSRRPAVRDFVGFIMPRVRPVVIGLCLTIGGLAAGRHPAAQQPATAQPAATAPTPPGPRPAERIKSLDPTTDGVALAAWHYPAPEGMAPLATVIVVHDLGGSHLTVEPLAKALQAGGCTVVVADLRGHGDSTATDATAGSGDPAKHLRPKDFEMIAASADGRMRDQAGVRGDIECLRSWIKRGTDSGKIQRAPLFLVGSGLGSLLASAWTIADAAWPDIASGPQGREVAGLVLISPPFVSKGMKMVPLLATELIGRSLPVMVLAGRGDRDAARVFDQFKRQRPGAWFDSRFPPGGERNASPVPAAEASALMFSVAADRSGDALAAARAARGERSDAASLILAFMRIKADDQP